jgi:hypothetical protein
MDRRSSIKTLVIICAATALLPSCVQDEKKKSSLALKNIKIDGNEEELLSKVSETIIPTTGTPGAKDISAHLFALMMVDDCYAPAEQGKFVKGLKAFEEFSKKKFNKPFVKCTPAERLEILELIENKKEAPQNVAFFYNNMKGLTIQAFTSSKYYLTKVHIYQLVPGKFYGCVPI